MTETLTEKEEQLWEAVFYQNLQTAEQLLQKGADPNLVRYGTTILCMAIEKGYFDMARLLLKYKADPNKLNTYLSWQDKEGHTYEIPYGTPEFSFTTLSKAIDTENAPMVKLLLDNGARQDIEAMPFWSHMQLAESTGNEKIISLLEFQLLESCMQDSSPPSDKRLTVVSRTDQPVEKTAMDNRDRKLCEAVVDGNLALLKTAIRSNANPNVKMMGHFRKRGVLYSEMYPLDCAINGREDDIIDALLESPRINVNIALDNYGTTPLIDAVRAQKVEVVRKLLQKGADPNTSTTAGFTALHGAVEQQNMELVGMLLAYKANPNVELKTGGRTPLYSAVARGYIGIAELLLVHGADPNAQLSGYSMLSKAIANQNVKMVELLLKYGAVPGAVGSKYPRSNIEQARDYRDKKIIELIEQYTPKAPSSSECSSKADLKIVSRTNCSGPDKNKKRPELRVVGDITTQGGAAEGKERV